MRLDSRAEAVIRGEDGDPFAYLGPHDAGDGRIVLRAFFPDASGIALLDESGRRVPSTPLHLKAGLFVIPVMPPLPRPYRFRVAWGATEVEVVDPYQFGPWLGDLDLHLLAEGTHERGFDRLGAHLVRMAGADGVVFAVWAPNAARVSVIGDFNLWDGRRHPMRFHPGAGLWELFIPGLGEGTLYKYEIRTKRGETLPPKADPFAFHAERPPATASIVRDTTRHGWQDQDWMAARARRDLKSEPMAIYEVHAGSWRRPLGWKAGERGWLGYDELARTLIPYVKEMGFTHIELLPVTEFPFDGSWGYQPTGLFAPTSRFGPPEAFQAFIDACHREGIGVILDWVAGHFPADPHGLAGFDGTCLYEHADPRQGFHRDWNTLIYNFGRTEVAEFLLNSALFWIERYHLDGLRVDAVASMLYRDYSRGPGEWVPNHLGGRENLEAVALLKRINTACRAKFPGIATIAEESTAWPLVSHPAAEGGLGFAFKWNMGWMHDTLRYMAEDPLNRSRHHDLLTFGLVYAFSENYILPLSHDEVVHGKRSILGRMPGDRGQRFANLRAYYGFMYAHPGKKLLFMGDEFGQEGEWNHDGSLDWPGPGDALNRGVRTLVRDLNAILRRYGALHRRDHEADGFAWIEAEDRNASVIAFERRAEGEAGREDGAHLVVVVNFTPVARRGYRIGVSAPAPYREIFNSDDVRYGGGGGGNRGPLVPEPLFCHGRAQSLALTLPPLAALYLAPA